LTNLKEARGNPLRLDRHADGRQPTFAPFGIGLRGVISEADRKSFWDYHPEYGPDGFVIPVHNSQRTGAPIIFVVPGDVDESEPAARGRSGITRVHVAGPGLRWPLTESVDGVEFEEATDLHMTVSLSGRGSAPALELSHRLTLC